LHLEGCPEAQRRRGAEDVTMANDETGRDNGVAATDGASVQRQLIQRSLSSLFFFFFFGVCSGLEFASDDLHVSGRSVELETLCFSRN
jgi:hypothetical protein